MFGISAMTRLLQIFRAVNAETKEETRAKLVDLEEFKRIIINLKSKDTMALKKPLPKANKGKNK